MVVEVVAPSVPVVSVSPPVSVPLLLLLLEDEPLDVPGSVSPVGSIVVPDVDPGPLPDEGSAVEPEDSSELVLEVGAVEVEPVVDSVAVAVVVVVVLVVVVVVVETLVDEPSVSDPDPTPSTKSVQPTLAMASNDNPATTATTRLE